MVHSEWSRFCERRLDTNSVINAHVNITDNCIINYAQISDISESFLILIQNISSKLLSCLGDDIVNIKSTIIDNLLFNSAMYNSTTEPIVSNKLFWAFIMEH